MAFQPSTDAELLELWRSLFPRGFSAPIEEEADGQGFDAFAQQIEQFLRASDAANVTTQAYYLRAHSTQTAPPSRGALAASGSVSVARSAPTPGPVTISEGTAFVADIRTPQGDVLDGSLFVATADTLLPAGSTASIAVPVVCSRTGYQGNVPADSIRRFALRGRATIPTPTIEAGNVLRDSGLPDRLTESMVGQYVRLIGGANGGAVPRRILSVTQGVATSTAVLDGAALIAPDTLSSAEVEEFADLGLEVSQPSDMAGGRSGFLDAIARDRNTGRRTGETDEALRLRLSFLDDVVSPAAIVRAASRALSPYGIRFRFLETRDLIGGIGGFIYEFSPYDAFDLFSPSGPVYVSLSGSTRFFVIVVSGGSQGEFGFAYDPPYPRNAYDGSNALNFFDGYPVGYMTGLAELWDVINRARAAGIGWLIVRDPSL